MAIPREFLGIYLAANAAALGVLMLAIWRPRAARWLSALLFAWAAVTNTQVAVSTPAAYLDYAPLTLLAAYRTFITGWFSDHIRAFVLPIAAGQAIVAILLSLRGPARTMGVAGAIIFLLAIAPLGVGAGFPFSLTMTAALLILNRREADAGHRRT
jgi:hypothetical protein